MVFVSLLESKLEGYIVRLLAKIPFVLVTERLLFFRYRIFYGNRENPVFSNNIANRVVRRYGFDGRVVVFAIFTIH